MNSTESKIAKLKNDLELAAFMVSKGEPEKETHSKIVQSLVTLSELEALLEKAKSSETQGDLEMEEVKKVNRRLKLWAKRQNQINSKILNAFLKLERSGLIPITETDLINELPNEKSFASNFVQMKIIAEKNHGKVFEQCGDAITLWKPVLSSIREYEKNVFKAK